MLGLVDMSGTWELGPMWTYLQETVSKKTSPTNPTNRIHTCHVEFHIGFSSTENVMNCPKLSSYKPKVGPWLLSQPMRIQGFSKSHSLGLHLHWHCVASSLTLPRETGPPECHVFFSANRELVVESSLFSTKHEDCVADSWCVYILLGALSKERRWSVRKMLHHLIR